MDDERNDGLVEIAGINAEERINRELAQYDDFYHLIMLLYRVADFQPPKKWIIPILKSRECADLKTQLMTAIEDYEELRCNDRNNDALA